MEKAKSGVAEKERDSAEERERDRSEFQRSKCSHEVNMKKIAILLILLAPLLMGQDIIYKSSAIVEWDAVTQLGNGDPIPAGWAMSYEAYVSDYPVVAPQDPASHTMLGATSSDQFGPITIDWYTHKAVGVRCKLVEDDLVTIYYSEIGWSYVPEVTDGSPFLYVRLSLNPPTGLRTQ